MSILLYFYILQHIFSFELSNDDEVFVKKYIAEPVYFSDLDNIFGKTIIHKKQTYCWYDKLNSTEQICGLQHKTYIHLELPPL